MRSETLTGVAMLAAALLTACDRATGPTDSSTPNTATPAFAGGFPATTRVAAVLDHGLHALHSTLSTFLVTLNSPLGRKTA